MMGQLIGYTYWLLQINVITIVIAFHKLPNLSIENHANNLIDFPFRQHSVNLKPGPVSIVCVYSQNHEKRNELVCTVNH
jgi:hypothetical protein